jgi:hypothetical protein
MFLNGVKNALRFYGNFLSGTISREDCNQVVAHEPSKYQ